MAEGAKKGWSPIVALALVAAAGTAEAQVVTSAAAGEAQASFYVGTVAGGEPSAPSVGRQPDEPRNPAAQRVSSGMAYDEQFTFPIEDGCNYTASIRGTIRPIAVGPEAWRKLEPDLAVTAVLKCPSAETLKVSEKVSGTGPMTRAEVESLLVRHASILREASGRRCSYVPDVSFVGEGLAGTGVTYLCARDKGEAKPERPKGDPAPSPKDER
jgi:hypothetical protein